MASEHRRLFIPREGPRSGQGNSKQQRRNGRRPVCQARPSYVDPRNRHVVLLIDHANERPITLCVLRDLDSNADHVAATQYPDRRKT
jgi:hypothetical protein